MIELKGAQLDDLHEVWEIHLERGVQGAILTLDLIEALKAAQVRAKKLQGLFLLYGEHMHDCDTWVGTGDKCTCGFLDEREQAEALLAQSGEGEVRV